MCVSGQYVYVSDLDKHCVSVFTAAGVHVTSFGRSGIKEEDFRVPCY